MSSQSRASRSVQDAFRSESAAHRTFIRSHRRVIMTSVAMSGDNGTVARAVTDEITPVPDVAGQVRNRLLGALPHDEYERLRPHLEFVHLDQRQALFEQEEPIRHVWFPETAVLSLVSRLRDGTTIEVGTAGFEGMAGLPLFLGDDTSSIRAFAQIPGAAVRIAAEPFIALARTPGTLHRMLLRYTQAFLTQVAQTAACNAVHLVDQRCARWLLMTHDRVGGDRFPLTHEFLAFMLSVRRAGVTVAMRKLHDEGIVGYTRGRVEVVDRLGLEAAACECYATVRSHFDRLLPALH